MKNQEPLNDWEDALHRELDALPELKAPSMLLPNVMAEVQRRARAPWYKLGWRDWPAAMQAASLVLMCSGVGTLLWFSGPLWEATGGQQISLWLNDLQANWAATASGLERVLGPGAAFWSQYGQMIMFGVAGILLGTYLTCITAGTALYRLAWKRTL